MDRNELANVSRRIGSLTLTATAHREVIASVEDIFDLLEKDSDNLGDGYSFWYGWGPYFVTARGKSLVVEAPDYDSFPLTGPIEDLTTPLRLIRKQAEFARSTGLQAVEIDFQDTILTTPGVDDTADLLLTWVEDPEDTTLVRCVHRYSDETRDLRTYESLPLWRGVQLIPSLGPALILQPGYTANLGTDGVTKLSDDESGEVVWRLHP
ncbi:MAG TPA: hypothetical protein H9830_12720 [Candidatus Agrococcus pullicola]|uniref:Uncharacterized protein n=1 Tax=Candidatus Agrococcus pullicola TaxID=2838429 RepID=A0A9D1YXW7_9MICO|nr:hypothetical protein [Candidatus Agrococcus pullicola]